VHALLGDLIERGLAGGHCLLVVIDGVKALRQAVGEVFGRRALIRRCQVHKRRNVLEALPERSRAETHRALNRAYAAGDVKGARRLLVLWCGSSKMLIPALPPPCAKVWMKP
jgi:putative transposase